MMAAPKLLLALLALVLLLSEEGALAQAKPETPPEQPAAADEGQSPGPGQRDERNSIAPLLGPLEDPYGLRRLLEDRGVSYTLHFIGETLTNAAGGQRRGTTYQGQFDLQIDVDLERLAGWKGAFLHTNVYQIHGRGLSRYYTGNLLTVSDIEALPATRLYELWVEQRLFDDKVSIRVGQLAADTEFLISQYALFPLNSSLGWPQIAGANLPGGGPAYPLATPGVRVGYQPSSDFTFLAALFNGNPAGPGTLKDPQHQDHSGFEFRTTDPALVIGEAQYAYNQDKDATGLAGTVKLGAWHHFGRFNDERYGADGLLLADPNESGPPRRLRGNSGIYAVLDQLLYRDPVVENGGLGLFLRASASPSDRNLIEAYADGGLTYKGLLPGRPDDAIGLSVIYAQVSNSVRLFDRDVQSFTGTPRPVHSSEILVEATYQALVAPGWTLQPDVQYVIRPGGGAVDARNPVGGRLRDAAIFGLRTSVQY